MIKANLKVALLVAKFEALRKNPENPPAGSGKPLPGALTQDEMSQLRAAIKANPEFDTKAKQTAAKLMAFQQKPSAAMVQSDPKLAPVLPKMGDYAYGVCLNHSRSLIKIALSQTLSLYVESSQGKALGANFASTSLTIQITTHIVRIS
jgi:hypothetical protein